MRTRLTGALLIGGPLLMALGRALLVPMDDQRWNDVLDDMSGAQARSDTGWLLAMAACGLLVLSAGSLARRLGEAGRSRSAGFALVTTALGWVGCGAICTGGVFMSIMAKAPHRSDQVKILTDFNDGNSAFIFLMCAAGAIGYVVLAVGLARAGAASKGAAVLIALGGASTLLTMPGPLKPLLVLTALLLTAGHALVLRSTADSPAVPPVPSPV